MVWYLVGVCGNCLLDPSEECDDCNTQAGDGCSNGCQLEKGYMCSKAWRSLSSPNEIGFLVNSDLSLSTNTESCAGQDAVCRGGMIWDAERWSNLYDVGVRATVPITGIYCSQLCSQSFPVPHGYAMGASCSLFERDMCAAASLDLAVICPPGTMCLNTPPGYTCRCVPGYFSRASPGCDESGIHITFDITVPLPGPSLLIEDDIRRVRRMCVFALQSAGYISLGFTTFAAVDAASEESVSKSIQWVKQATWRVMIRVAQSDAILEPERGWAQVATVLNATLTQGYAMVVGPKCDYKGKCINEAPLVDVSIQDAAIGPTYTNVDATGFELLWMYYDDNAFKWVARIAFAHYTGSSSRVLFVSGRDLSASLGVTSVCSYEQSIEAPMCCLKQFLHEYSVAQAFEQVVNASNSANCDSYQSLAQVPVGSAHGDYVTGPLLQSPTLSSFSTEVSPGVIDVHLFYNDIRQHGAIFSQDTDTAVSSVTFFIGVANVKKLGGSISIAAPNVAVYTSFTTSYVLTTQLTTDKSFSPTISIALVRVFNQQAQHYYDFVRFDVGTYPYVTSVADLDSIRAARSAIGYTPDALSASGHMLCALSNASAPFREFQLANPCVFQDPVCEPIMASEHAATFHIYFPLGVDALSPTLLRYETWNALTERLYMDFFIRVRDTMQGVPKILLHRVYTASSISTRDIMIVCR